jgi:hypothetical protein
MWFKTSTCILIVSFDQRHSSISSRILFVRIETLQPQDLQDPTSSFEKRADVVQDKYVF